ncbi:transposase InsO family protein [Geodermatophilus bullaregiensis]|nr:transposase InsO family protein [Geodermatophilus bullaregiensis]
MVPLVTIVTDNGGPFRSFRFEAFIATHPELRHVRTRVKTPGRNGSRERGFGSLKYEKLLSVEGPPVNRVHGPGPVWRLEMVPARSRGQGGAPYWTNDLDRGEDRHRLLAAEGRSERVRSMSGSRSGVGAGWSQGQAAVRGRPALSRCAQPGSVRLR